MKYSLTSLQVELNLDLKWMLLLKGKCTIGTPVVHDPADAKNLSRLMKDHYFCVIMCLNKAWCSSSRDPYISVSLLQYYHSFGSLIGIWMVLPKLCVYPDSKVHGTNMGPRWGRQDPGGPHVGPMNFANCVSSPQWYQFGSLKCRSWKCHFGAVEYKYSSGSV